MKTALVILGLLPALAWAAPVKLNVDKDHSHLEIDVKATVDSFTGKLEDYQPEITLDDAGNVQAATFTFQFNDVKTGKNERDHQMHDWQQTATFPAGAFKLATVTRAEDGALQAKGSLTLHGVSKELAFPITISRDGSLMAIDGTVRLDTRDFGLPIIRKFMLLKVDPGVVIRFHMQGTPSSAPVAN